MTVLPSVLGLGEQDALVRLQSAGYGDVSIQVSGRRREGEPRVIRQKLMDGRVELVISYFKTLDGVQ